MSVSLSICLNSQDWRKFRQLELNNVPHLTFGIHTDVIFIVVVVAGMLLVIEKENAIHRQTDRQTNTRPDRQTERHETMRLTDRHGATQRDRENKEKTDMGHLRM